VFDGSYYQYEDLQSTNGTKINGNPVLRCRLRLMDKIELGATVLLYWEGSEEDADFLAAWRREKEALL
jgi:pSer/pThr/pTyr-binding forkhead associated (FHA) protein